MDQKQCTKTKMVIDRGSRSKTPNKLNPVENKNKNSLNFLEKGPVQNEVPPSHKLQDHAYE